MEKVMVQKDFRPAIVKTNIESITKSLTRRITALGYDIYISFSGVSKSRYLEIMLTRTSKIFVRISDHAAEKSKRRLCTFDVYTDVKRPGAVDYNLFFKTFRNIVRNPENELKKTRFVRIYKYSDRPAAINSHQCA